MMIGDELKSARLRANATQEWVAEMLGIGEPHVSKVERNREVPSVELLASWARLLGLDPDVMVLTTGRLPGWLSVRVTGDPIAAMNVLRCVHPTPEGNETE